MVNDSFSDYRRHWRGYVGTDQRIVRVGDFHASHRPASFKQLAVALNMEMPDIPAGATDLTEFTLFR
jgi:hypothetical protein